MVLPSVKIYFQPTRFHMSLHPPLKRILGQLHGLRRIQAECNSLRHQLREIGSECCALAERYASILESGRQFLPVPIQVQDQTKVQRINYADLDGGAAAIANKEGTIHRSTSLYEIPRFVVRDWTADELDRRLRQWFRIR